MGRSSIRQPLVVYAVVAALLICLGVLGFSGIALSRASNRAYGRAVREELLLLERAGLQPGQPHPRARVQLGLVTTSTPCFGLNSEAARTLAYSPVGVGTQVAVPTSVGGEEAYLVADFPSAEPGAVALFELSRLMPQVLALSLLAAGLMSLLVYRQLLPSLRALSDLAEDTSRVDEPKDTDAPNEIAEIAQRFRDSTRLLREARERAEAQRDELEQMQSSLIRASKLASVGRLAAGIAHEIGNPLAAVKGYLSLMKDGLPEEQTQDVLQRSVRQLGRIQETIEKLLTYARTGTEQVRSASPFRLRGPVDEALALARGHPSIREAEIVDAIPADGLEAVGIDDRVSQVLVNLLLNAGQAMANAPERRIVLERRLDEDRVEILVADTGPGVPLAAREGLFDPFFTTKGPGEGTGLGLAVSRAMMEAMGGSLELLPSEAGARFVARLPLARPASTSVG